MGSVSAQICPSTAQLSLELAVTDALVTNTIFEQTMCSSSLLSIHDLRVICAVDQYPPVRKRQTFLAFGSMCTQNPTLVSVGACVYDGPRPPV